MGSWGGIWSENRLLRQMGVGGGRDIAKDRTLAQLGTEPWNTLTKNLERAGENLGTAPVRIVGCMAGDRVFRQLGAEFEDRW